MSEVIFFKSKSELHAWFIKNHDTARELLVGFYKKSSKNSSVTYPKALDEALCFGWIDGVRKSIDEVSYTIRFTPRRAKSNWSLVNIRRVGELTKLGLMQSAGLKAFAESDPKRREYSYERKIRKLDTVCEKKLKANKKAWNLFQAQPPWYQRTVSFWVMSAKKEETRLRRLTVLIRDSANGERLGVVTLKPKTKLLLVKPPAA